MLVEFYLPRGENRIWAPAALHTLKLAIIVWTSRYNVGYTEKTVKYTHRLCFEQEKDYTLFALTWDYNRVEWAIITDRNRWQVPKFPV